MRRKFLIIFLTLAVVTLPLVSTLTPVQAQSSLSGYDLIALINDWRVNQYGYPALVENAILMQCAQWTAETMASMNADGHLTFYGYQGASPRCSSMGFGGGKTVFVTENWAGGPNLDYSTLYGYWDDPDHRLPASDARYLYYGVGVAKGSNGYYYYVLHAGAISGEKVASSSGGTGVTSVPAGTQVVNNFVVTVQTSTPDADGTIYHIVKSGETLYTIAVNYGISVETIMMLNNMTTDEIYPGNKLKIRLLPTATITPTRTPTIQAPTRTATATSLPATPRPTRTITPTPQPSLSNLLPKIDRQWLGLGLLVLSAVGFFVVFYFSFLKPMRKK